MSRTTNPEELMQAIRDWVEAVTGRACYIQNQMGPQPIPDPYATIYLRDFDPQGHQRATLNDDGDVETVTGHAACTFSISLWQGTNTLALSNKLRSSIWGHARNFDLWEICGKGAVGDIRDLTSTFGRKFEPRHEFDFTVHAALAETFTGEYFDGMTVEVYEHDRGKVAEFNGGDPVTTTEGC